jgi:hypothetical protein
MASFLNYEFHYHQWHHRTINEPWPLLEDSQQISFYMVTSNLEDQASVVIPLGDKIAQLYPRALSGTSGSPFPVPTYVCPERKLCNIFRRFKCNFRAKFWNGKRPTPNNDKLETQNICTIIDPKEWYFSSDNFSAINNDNMATASTCYSVPQTIYYCLCM